MSESNSPTSEYHVVTPAEHAGLTCRFLKPADFTLAEIPSTPPDFSDAGQFLPLAVAMTSVGPMVFSVAARPAFEDGAVSQWLEYICRKEGYPHSPVAETRIGGLPAVWCDATQAMDNGTVMKMRFVLLEDGGRLFQMSAMAPEIFWSVAVVKMEPMLASLELREVRGTVVALLPGRSAPLATPTLTPAPTAAATAPATAASEPPVSQASEPTLESARLQPADLIALALADDVASLDADHPVNANLRDRGVGLVPRVAGIDTGSKSVRLAAGAVEGFFRLPFGWHAIDDGRRTLIFDAGGCLQVNLSQRLHEGRTLAEMGHELLLQYLENQPDLPMVESRMGELVVSGVRNVTIGPEVLDQFFMVRDLGWEGRYLVAKISATSEHTVRGLNLAGDIMATFSRLDEGEPGADANA